MTEYVTDEEQVERIKKWWADNGSSVIAGLVIGFGGLAGWRFWVDYKDNLAAEASAHFSDMVAALDSSKHDDAIKQANIILDEYSSTPYADLAQLSLAKAFVEGARFEDAERQLKSLVSSTSEYTLEMVARTRLAAVQMQLGKLSEALSTLDVKYPAQFTAAFEELKGDIHAAQGDKVAAREAYQRATTAEPAVPDIQFLQQKLDDLGGASASS
jgi:predicted negative regulator of RcsB-dependent stress response